jgi:uncharacterized protein
MSPPALESAARIGYFMTSENLIEFGSGSVDLDPLPIKPHWVLEGAPAARCKAFWSTADGMAKVVIWDCSAGRFNWYYDQDETVYLIEGSVLIKDSAGRSRRLSAGDTIVFRAGSHAEWTVDNYVRKYATVHTPVPKYALLVMRLVRAFRRMTGLSRGDAPTMFG